MGDRKRIKAMDRSTPQVGHRMGLTENTPAALLALHCLDVRPNSAATPGHVMALRAAGGGFASSSP